MYAILNYDDLILSERSSYFIPLAGADRDIVGNSPPELQLGLSPKTLCAYLQQLKVVPKALNRTGRVSHRLGHCRSRSSSILSILFTLTTPFYL